MAPALGTLVEVTAGPGGQQSSLAAAETASDLNLKTLGQRYEITGKAGRHTGSQLTISGATTDTEHNRRFKAEHSHALARKTGVQLAFPVDMAEVACQLAGFEITSTVNDLVQMNAAALVAEDLLLWNDGTRNGVTLPASGSNVIVRNVAAIKCSTGFVRNSGTYQRTYLIGCAAIRGTARGYVLGDDIGALGCYGFLNATEDFNLTAGGNQPLWTNMSGDATAPGVGSLINKALANQIFNSTDGNEDLHLLPGADAIMAAINAEAYGVPGNLDALGVARLANGPWCIGPHELAVPYAAIASAIAGGTVDPIVGGAKLHKGEAIAMLLRTGAFGTWTTQELKLLLPDGTVPAALALTPAYPSSMGTFIRKLVAADLPQSGEYRFTAHLAAGALDLHGVPAYVAVRPQGAV